MIKTSVQNGLFVKVTDVSSIQDARAYDNYGDVDDDSDLSD